MFHCDVAMGATFDIVVTREDKPETCHSSRDQAELERRAPRPHSGALGAVVGLRCLAKKPDEQ